jgi:hypothetical protein
VVACEDAPVSVLALAEVLGWAFVAALVPVCAALFAVFSVLFTAPFAVFSAPLTAPVAVLAAPLTALVLLALPFADTFAPAALAFALPVASTLAFFVASLAVVVASDAAPFAVFSAVPAAEFTVPSAVLVAPETVLPTGAVEGKVAPMLPLALPIPPALIPPAPMPPPAPRPPPNPAAKAGAENTIALPRRSAAAPLRNVMVIFEFLSLDRKGTATRGFAHTFSPEAETNSLAHVSRLETRFHGRMQKNLRAQARAHTHQ